MNKTFENLVLVRLLASPATGDTQAKLKKDLGPVVAHRYVGAELDTLLDETITRLVSQQAIMRTAKNKLQLAEPGRVRARDYLGLNELPQKLTWSQLRNIYLVARSLGVQADTAEAKKKLSTVTGLRAAVLREAHGLPGGPLPTPKQAVDALLWKQLGVETKEAFGVTAVKTHLLRQMLGDGAGMTPAQLTGAVAAKAVGARRNDKNGLCQALLQRLVEEGTEAPPHPTPVAPPAPPAPAETGLPEFAEMAREAARESPTGWFGDPRVANKVFIVHAYRSFIIRHEDASMSLDQFKQRLVEAHRKGLLQLSRADLVDAMDPADVRESETHYLHSDFHFIRVRD